MNQSSLFVEKVLPTILIVDDIPANIAVITDILEAHDYRVLVAQDGAEGLRRVDFVHPDLILLDVMMPGMDGFEVCRTLKKQASTRDIPVIFMTARSEIQDKLAGFEAGGVDYVTKPLQADEVLARIETHIKMSDMQKRLELQNAQLQRYREQLEQRVVERTSELEVSKQHLREETQERKRTQERLALVDFALNQTPEAVYISSNLDHRFVYVNAEASNMLGYSSEELLSMSMSIVDLDPDTSMEELDGVNGMLSSSGSMTFERRHKAKDGRIFPVEMVITPLEYQGKRLVLSMVRDITERKQKEALLLKLSRKLKAISMCNHMLVRAENEQELLNGICKLVCDEAGYVMAWVGFAENDENKTVRPVAYSGYEKGYLDGIQITWADTERGQVPIGIAIRTGVAAINHDFQTYPGLAPWREAVKRRGFQSSIAVPLVSNGHVFGSLNIYSAEVQAFANEEEVALLQELADDIAYGVLSLRSRDEIGRAVSKLRVREQEFRAMIENSPDNIARYDSQCRRIYVNPSLQAQFSLPVDEVLGKTPKHNSPLSDVPKYMQGIQKVLETGREERLEFFWNSPQGVKRWGDLRLAPEYAKDGTIASVLAISRDITERKRIEQDLVQRESELRSVMESSPDTVIRYDHEGRIAYANSNFLNRLNVSAKEVIGKLPNEVWPDGSFAEVEQGVFRVLETKESVRVELLRDIEGETRYQEIRIAPEWNNIGTVVIGAIIFGRDITDLRRYEQAIEESRTQLRGLAAKNEMVREEERKYIAREVHDELGQILTGLQLNISVLEHLAARQSLPLREHLQETKILMDKSLSVARNVATALRPAVLDMGVVSALDWLTGRYSTNTGIRCELDIADNEIKLDEKQSIALFRIVQEALTNVSRHAKASRVDISLAQVADDYVLKIRDNGLGFDVSVKKLDSFGVVGIRERALLLDGTVTINSSPGSGTEINVRIPVNKKSEMS